MELPTKNCNLVIVSTVERSSVDFSLWQSFKDIVVQPLFKGSVFAGKLNNFLGDNSSEECAVADQRRVCVSCSVSQNGLIDCLNRVMLMALGFLVNLLCDIKHLICLVVVRVTTVCVASMKRSHREMKLI